MEFQANLGDKQAQYNLACRRRAKRKFVGDDGAVHWYKKAAESEHVLAQFNLGLLFKNGFGVEANLVQAVYWLEKAANHGHADAQYELGLCLEGGIGVKKDLTLALSRFKEAADQGHKDAQGKLDEHARKERELRAYDMCPHCNVSAQKCNLLIKLQNQSSQACRNFYQAYTMMGLNPAEAEWRAAFCSTSKWVECAVNVNEQRGHHR